MTKKYLCGVVSAAVLMGACPTAVFAADLENPLDFRKMCIRDSSKAYPLG